LALWKCRNILGNWDVLGDDIGLSIAVSDIKTIFQYFDIDKYVERNIVDRIILPN
jgi:hypothetical protein